MTVNGSPATVTVQVSALIRIGGSNLKAGEPNKTRRVPQDRLSEFLIAFCVGLTGRLHNYSTGIKTSNNLAGEAGSLFLWRTLNALRKLRQQVC